MLVNLLPDTSVIPASAMAALNAQVLSVQRLSKGMTNQNYKVVTAKGEFIVRVPGVASDILINREDEYCSLAFAASLQLDVETVYFDRKTGIKITVFLNDSWPDPLDKMVRFSFVSNVLKRLHHSETPLGPRFDPLEKIAAYEHIMYRYNVPFEPGYGDVVSKLRNMSGEGRPFKLVPCHNDPVPENFLKDPSGRVYLIDWEYAGTNDLLWDVAAYSLENDLCGEDEKKFLDVYFNGMYVSEDIRKRLLLCKIQQDVLWSLWSSIKTHLGKDFSSYGRERYKRACRCL